jgi:hypothetical protein
LTLTIPPDNVKTRYNGSVQKSLEDGTGDKAMRSKLLPRDRMITEVDYDRVDVALKPVLEIREAPISRPF